jgi:hypothetical protein
VALSHGNAQHMTGEGSEEHAALPDSRATGRRYRQEVITESIQTLTTLDHVHGGFHLDMKRFTRGTERYLCAGAMMPSDELNVLA